jgi:hypothetical protein
MISYRIGDQNLTPQAPPCFGRHVKPSRLHLQSLAPIPVSRRVDGRRPVVKIIAKYLSQHDEKHVVPTPLSGIRVGKRRKEEEREALFFNFVTTTRDNLKMSL